MTMTIFTVETRSWLRHYDPGVPFTLKPYPAKTLCHTVAEAADAQPDGPAVLFNVLLNHPRVKSGWADFTSLKLNLCGAAPLLLETKERFEDLTGGRIIEAYALTESVMAAVMTPVYGQYKEGAVGIPLPDVEVRIAVPKDDRRTLPQGEVGHILMRAPQLMAGYWNDPERTAETIRDGWLLTGDTGYLGADGSLFMADHLKDPMKVSGWQVWPREVEEVLASHPAIGEVCAGRVPDPLRGEAVKAWVVLRRGSEASEADLRAYCREHLAAYKVPRQVEFCEGLPKSTIGKVLHRELTRREKALPVREMMS